MTWGPHILLTNAPWLDGDGNGGRAVKSAADRIELDLEAANRLLESMDLPPIEPGDDGVISLDSAGRWRYRPVGTPNRREPTVQLYERVTPWTPVPWPAPPRAPGGLLGARVDQVGEQYRGNHLGIPCTPDPAHGRARK